MSKRLLRSLCVLLVTPCLGLVAVQPASADSVRYIRSVKLGPGLSCTEAKQSILRTYRDNSIYHQPCWSYLTDRGIYRKDVFTRGDYKYEVRKGKLGDWVTQVIKKRYR